MTPPLPSDRQAAALIARLALAPHPEGGWYRETWRAPDLAGARGAATAILFLLAAGERSHWHRVDADELWLWHAGAPLALLQAQGDAAPVSRIALGGDVLAGQQPQARVPAGWWQAAEAEAGWTLVSCVVAPAFRFEGFELAPPGWAPDQPSG
ncbi:cupin domain-containing protein [Sphingomonas sp. ac-8]|uniref:cupin domain-containing protein n=1 Tax=Sphingomonas sp. ac-8 TaxID=3242977 RepID=UPI003A813CA1